MIKRLKLIEDTSKKYKYIIAMSKLPIKDIVNNESNLEAYVTEIFTRNQLEDPTKEIGYSFSPIKNKAKLFDSKYEANNIAGKIKNNYPEWKTVIAILADSKNLTEDEDDLEKVEDKVEDNLEAQENLEDTIDSEENQEENPVEEETDLDKQLNELRDILIDLDLNLYQITSKDDLNNSIYIIGKVADNSDDVLMLVDTKPEEINNDIELEEPIINDIEEDDEEIEPSEEKEDNKSELEQRFDFVTLPKSFEEINKLNPRYGADLTPDHEAIVEYLMNCLIEINPEAAEELQKEEPSEEIAEPTEIEDEIDVEEELEDEE